MVARMRLVVLANWRNCSQNGWSQTSCTTRTQSKQRNIWHQAWTHTTSRQFNDNSLRSSAGPGPDCRAVNTVLRVVKNRTYMRCFYCIEGVHNTPIESSEFRFIGWVLELVVRGPSFLICVKPGHGYTTSLPPPPPPPPSNHQYKQGQMWDNQTVDSDLLCGGYTLPTSPTLHDRWGKTFEMIQRLKSSGFPLMP